MHPQSCPPVLTIDGPSSSGKGTVSHMVATRLGWHLLDSGLIYRAAAYAVDSAGVNLEHTSAVTSCVENSAIRFQETIAHADAPRVLVNDLDVTELLRTEATAALASSVAAIPAVRQALTRLQLDFRKAPGLVADGRDMGSIIFPDAEVKIFLMASALERAKRRHKQLKEKDVNVTIADLERDIDARDRRDALRSVAPLKAPAGAVLIDSTHLSVAEVVDKILALVHAFAPVPL